MPDIPIICRNDERCYMLECILSDFKDMGVKVFNVLPLYIKPESDNTKKI